jgi:hypothetical protein
VCSLNSIQNADKFMDHSYLVISGKCLLSASRIFSIFCLGRLPSAVNFARSIAGLPIALAATGGRNSGTFLTDDAGVIEEPELRPADDARLAGKLEGGTFALRLA